MTTVRMTIPDDFILGAAASAWQTEGWSGKKPGQDSWPDLWYKNDRHVWHNGYGPAVATDFINRFQEDVQLMKLAGLASAVVAIACPVAGSQTVNRFSLCAAQGAPSIYRPC